MTTAPVTPELVFTPTERSIFELIDQAMTLLSEAHASLEERGMRAAVGLFGTALERDDLKLNQQLGAAVRACQAGQILLGGDRGQRR